MAGLKVRDLTREDHDAALDARHRSFGPLAPEELAWWNPLFERTVDARRGLGVFDGQSLVATARIHAYAQVWGGRPVPMAGVAGVVVAPEWRGRGVATLLMRAVLERAVELSDVVSVLYPAAVPPYRRIGYEVAGSFSKTTLPAAALRALGVPGVGVRRASLADTDAIVDLLRRDTERARASGPLALTADDVRELLGDADNFCYLAADGFVAYAWDGADLLVERLAADSPETTRALWALVGSGASAVRRVSTFAPAHDAVHWIVDAQAEGEVTQERWMLRVLDARRAIAERGFPAGLAAAVPLRLDDPLLESCAGAFELRVSSGGGELASVGEVPADAVRLGPNGFAALYAGIPTSTLRRAGLVSGGSAEQHARLDAAFAATPYLLDRF